MTLPHPHETETGTLDSKPTSQLEPLDLRSRVVDLIQLEDGRLIVSGCELQPSTGSPKRTALEFQQQIAQRLLERRPNADEATWEAFVTKLRGMLQGTARSPEEALRQILQLIDGL